MRGKKEGKIKSKKPTRHKATAFEAFPASAAMSANEI